MRFLVIGSLNIDLIFSVDHIVQAGETISSNNVQINAGGKGANQAAAIGKAGLNVYFAGKCNENARWIIDLLESFGVNTSFSIISSSIQTGQAIIQIDKLGQNSIILNPGGNNEFTEYEIDMILSQFGEGDGLILQNEINLTQVILKKAKQKKLKIFLNPSPFDLRASGFCFEYVDYLFLNEVEACNMMGLNLPESFDGSFYRKMGKELSAKYPSMSIIITVGKNGSFYFCNENVVYMPIVAAPVVDTTGAGDTFCGYFISGIANGLSPENALIQGTIASSITVSKKGAMTSFPYKSEVEKKYMEIDKSDLLS